MENLVDFQDYMNSLFKTTSDKLCEKLLNDQNSSKNDNLNLNNENNSECKNRLLAYFHSIDINNIDDLTEKLTESKKLSNEIISSVTNIIKRKSMALNNVNCAVDSVMDNNLCDPWGILVHDSKLYVVNNKSRNVGCYDFCGKTGYALITFDDCGHNVGSPTGICVNNSNKFLIRKNDIAVPAKFLICTKNGTVHGYVDGPDAFDNTVINQQLTGKVTMYTGLVVVNETLYVVDFFGKKIDLFNGDCGKIYCGNKFVDGDKTNPIPSNYSPYNIVHIGEYLYVLYVRQNQIILTDKLDGPGCGFISVFTLDGTFVKRFASLGVLNSPSDMIPVPDDQGYPEGGFLVGNGGDGRIHIFDSDGKYFGPLLNNSGSQITINGLRGMASCVRSEGQYEIYTTSSNCLKNDGLVTSIVKDKHIYF